MYDKSPEILKFESTDMAASVAKQGFGMKMGAFGLFASRKIGQSRTINPTIKHSKSTVLKLQDLEESKAK